MRWYFNVGNTWDAPNFVHMFSPLISKDYYNITKKNVIWENYDGTIWWNAQR